MKTTDKYIVLIPHRDTGRLLEEYRHKLFFAGIAGAYSFPAAAPLALVSKAFTRDELKETARAVRRLSLKNGGKISAEGKGKGEPGAGNIRLSFSGLLLDLPWDGSVFAGNPKLLYRFPRPLLCTALTGEEAAGAELPPEPALSFRAAMIANLWIRPLKTGEEPYSFEWKLSPPVWLPKTRSF